MAGWSGIDHHPLVGLPALREDVTEREDPENLVGAGQRGVHEPADVVRVQVGAAVEDGGDRLAPAGEEPVPKSRGVEGPRVEPVSDGDGDDGPLDRTVEGGEQRRSRVGGDDEGAKSGRRKVSARVRLLP